MENIKFIKNMLLNNEQKTRNSAMQTKITANTKKLVRKRQHIKSLMCDLYKETSPNSKILKYLLQNPHSLPKPQNLLPYRSLRKTT